MNEFYQLNPDNFKKWIKSQKDDFHTTIKKSSILGSTAETKLSLKRIIENINIESGKRNKVAKDFCENGGTVRDILNEEYLIEVQSGFFYINKKYVIV